MLRNDWYLIMKNGLIFESLTSVSVTVAIRAEMFAKVTIAKWKGGGKEVCSRIAIWDATKCRQCRYLTNHWLIIMKFSVYIGMFAEPNNLLNFFADAPTPNTR